MKEEWLGIYEDNMLLCQAAKKKMVHRSLQYPLMEVFKAYSADSVTSFLNDVLTVLTWPGTGAQCHSESALQSLVGILTQVNSQLKRLQHIILKKRVWPVYQLEQDLFNIKVLEIQ